MVVYTATRKLDRRGQVDGLAAEVPRARRGEATARRAPIPTPTRSVYHNSANRGHTAQTAHYDAAFTPVAGRALTGLV